MKGTSQIERDTFKALRSKYGKDTVVSPHILRSEVSLTNTDSILTFPVLEDSIQPLKTEIRLNKNDVMFMTGIGMFIYPKVTGAEGKGVLQTYANQQVFPAVAGPPAFAPNDLDIVYNGVLRLQVGSTEYIPGLDLSVFRWVPQTQQSSAANYSQDDEDAGFIDLSTFYQLRGNDQILFTAKLPLAATTAMAAQAANTTNQLVLKMRGFLIKGGANLMQLEA